MSSDMHLTAVMTVYQATLNQLVAEKAQVESEKGALEEETRQLTEVSVDELQSFIWCMKMCYRNV